jgi:ABC-type dipeptide/oligopeptide/nickel transport system permease component
LHAALTREFGLNQSLPVQYVKYLDQLVHLNLGVSFYNQTPVVQNLRTDVVNTFEMVLLGTIVAMALGIVAGVIAAWRRGTTVDHGIVLPSLVLYALPTQWLGLMLIVFLGSTLPTSGRINYFLVNPTFWQHWTDVLRHMILPSLTIGVALFGQFVLIVRSAVMETLGEDYILVARGVGYSPRRILTRYALRNAMLPIISAVALTSGFLVGGAILVETVFSWPGVGLAVYNAILQRDYPMMQGAFLVLTVSVILCNFAADMMYLKLDPRVS